MAALLLRKAKTRIRRAVKTTLKRRKELTVFFATLVVLSLTKHFLKWEFPVFYYDLAEHSALLVELWSMAKGDTGLTEV